MAVNRQLFVNMFVMLIFNGYNITSSDWEIGSGIDYIALGLYVSLWIDLVIAEAL